jgi:hypothetical protein
MIVISQHSVHNHWVMAEVDWALGFARPIVAVQLDSHGWGDVLRELGRVNESHCDT